MRIGWINYLNTEPFNFEKTGIKPNFQYTLVKGVPSFINRLLSEGKIDAGFISSAHYIENYRQFVPLPELSISSLNKVQSVIILSDAPLGQVKTVFLTKASKTSRYLTRVIFRKFIGREPEYRELEDEDITGKEAVLLIGDSAIKHSGKKRFTYDLSSIWYRETGLPFVFALWCVRKEYYTEHPETVKKLFYTLKLSKNRFFETPDKFQKDHKKIQYLKNLDYCLSTQHIESLKLFSQYLKEAGIIKEIPDFRFGEVQ
ncbi:menaquinone biosynthetic enzyme MqnA/MqnD family protein [Persephonella sp.]